MALSSQRSGRSDQRQRHQALDWIGSRAKAILQNRMKTDQRSVQAAEDGRHMRILSAFILVCFALITTSCYDAKPLASGSMLAGKLKQIEAGTGLVFPASSRVIQFSEASVVFDPAWIAKIVIPDSSYAQFKETVLRKPRLNATESGGLEDSTSWWKPVPSDVTKQYLADTHTFVKVVFSKENGDWVVYVSCATF